MNGCPIILYCLSPSTPALAGVKVELTLAYLPHRGAALVVKLFEKEPVQPSPLIISCRREDD